MLIEKERKEWQSTESQTPSFTYADAFDDSEDPQRKAIEDQYNYMKSSTAKDLLDRQIQTEQAKLAAQRSLETNLAAKGLSSGGYYGNANSQLQASYMAQQNKNLAEYQEALRQAGLSKELSLAGLDQTEREAYANDILANIANAKDVDSALSYLGNYGISATKGDDGNYSLAGDNLGNLSANQRSQILSALTGAYDRANATSAETMKNYLTSVIANGVTDLERFNKAVAPYGISVAKDEKGNLSLVGDGVSKMDNDTLANMTAMLNAYYDPHAYLDEMVSNVNAAPDLDTAMKYLNNYGIQAVVGKDGKYVLTGEGAKNLAKAQENRIADALTSAGTRVTETSKEADMLNADYISSVLANGIADIDRFRALLEPYGISVEITEDGRRAYLDGKGLSNYDQNTINRLNSELAYAYDPITTWLQENTLNSKGFNSVAQAKELDLRTENADYDIDDVEKEAETLFRDFSYGREDGDAVRLEHYGGGSANGMYLIYFKGKWYQTDRAHFNQAENKGFFKNGKLEHSKSSGTFTEQKNADVEPAKDASELRRKIIAGYYDVGDIVTVQSDGKKYKIVKGETGGLTSEPLESESAETKKKRTTGDYGGPKVVKVD